MIANTVRDVAAIIRDRRRQLGWTQAQVASKIGVGREWVIQCEKGKLSVEWGILELARTGAPLKAFVSFHGDLLSPTLADDTKNIVGKVLVLNRADNPVVAARAFNEMQRLS